jgi:hypothetical protein
MTERHEFTYRGSPALASLFVQMLTDQGATVEWEPPYEERGAGTFITAAVVGGVVGNAAYDLVKMTAKRFLARFPRCAIVLDGEEVAPDETSPPNPTE